MKDTQNLFARLKKMMPAGIEPAFKTSEELMAWQKAQGEQRAIAIARENQAKKMERAFGRSGIRELHRNCSFDNYHASTPAQQHIKEAAWQYAMNFGKNMDSFIFFGNPGTGKNHLAAAICNELLIRNKTVLIITVADIMSAMKQTFSSDSQKTEEHLLDDLSTVDLLVIDEIGVQLDSRYEKVIINQIVDRRSSSRRPTGMLTNLDAPGLARQLGERVVDRMRLGHSLLLTFDWESYRDRVS